MVRPFVKAGPGGTDSGGRRGRQGSDGGASGGRPRQGAPGGGQGRQQPNSRAPQNGRGRPNSQGGQGGQGGQGQGVPAPRPPRDANPQQVPGLVSTPMPAPRAVAGHRRPENLAPYPELDPPLSDLTTTMPILAVPADDGYDDEYDGHPEYDNAAPGEHGHYHDDADFGRHRGGNRPPRALKIGALLAGVAVVGVAAYSVLGGGSGSPAAGRADGGASTTGAAGTPSDSGSSSAADAPAPTGTPTGPGSDSSTQTSASASHTTKTSTKPTTTSHSSSPSTSVMASRPSSAPSTTTTTSAPPTPSNPSPTFNSLAMGSTGPAVKQLQQNLQSLGYWVTVSGTFDAATRSAVRSFQDANPGTAQADGYGVYGAATDKAMQQAVG